MQLPQIPVPLSLPFEVPTLLHPAVVHFAVVLPMIVLVLELANLMFKRRALSVTSLGLLLLTIVVYLAAYFTGKADGGAAFDMLGADARGELQAHRILGTYLLYALLIPLLFKLLAMLMAQKWARGALVVTLVMFISFVVKQGYDGGELVYKYGVNVAAVSQAREAAEDLNETVADQTEEIAALKAEVEAMKAKAQEGFGEAVNKAVNEAVTKVKKIFTDKNESAEQPAAENGAHAEPSEQNASGAANGAI